MEQLYNHYPKDIKQVLFVNYPGDSKEDRVINLKLVYVNTKNEIVLYGVHNVYDVEGTVDVNKSKVEEFRRRV